MKATTIAIVLTTAMSQQAKPATFDDTACVNLAAAVGSMWEYVGDDDTFRETYGKLSGEEYAALRSLLTRVRVMRLAGVSRSIAVSTFYQTCVAELVKKESER